MPNHTGTEFEKSNVLRPLDRAESNFWLYDRVSSMNFAVFAELEGTLSVQTLEEALRETQSKYANANVSIEKKEEEDTTYLAFVAEPEAKISLSIRFDSQDWKGDLGKEAIRHFPLGEAPLVRAYIYSNRPEKYVFALVFHHSIADGRSGSLFLLETLERYGKSERGSDSNYKRYDSLMSLYPGKTTEESRPKRGAKPDVLPNFSRKKEDALPKLDIFDIEKEELKALIAKSKKNGVSLHGLIGALQVRSLAKLFSDPSPKTILLATPADLRPYLDEEIPKAALGLYISVFTTETDPGESVWEIASKINADLRSKLERGEGRVFYELLPEAKNFLQKEESMRVFSSLLQRNPQAFVLSNVGVLPDSGDPPGLKILRVGFTVHPSVTQVFFATLSTFRDRACFVLNFDSNRWRSEDIRTFQEAFREGILEILNS